MNPLKPIKQGPITKEHLYSYVKRQRDNSKDERETEYWMVAFSEMQVYGGFNNVLRWIDNNETGELKAPAWGELKSMLREYLQVQTPKKP